jgi:hypothetical protein
MQRLGRPLERAKAHHGGQRLKGGIVEHGSPVENGGWKMVRCENLGLVLGHGL